MKAYDNVTVYICFVIFFSEMDYFPFKTYYDFSTQNNECCCSICYAYRTNEEIPIISCDNEKCDVIFHMTCLKNWFSTQVNSKRFLNVTLGTCPFCKEKISKSFMSLIKKDLNAK